MITFFLNNLKRVDCGTCESTAILSNDGACGPATGLPVKIYADSNGFDIELLNRAEQNNMEMSALRNPVHLSFKNIQMVPYGNKGAFLITFTKAYQRRASKEFNQENSRQTSVLNTSKQSHRAMDKKLNAEMPLSTEPLLNLGIILNDAAMILFFKSRLDALLGYHIMSFVRQHQKLLMFFSLLVAFLITLYFNITMILNVLVSDTMAKEMGERVAAHPMIQAQACLDATNSPQIALLEDAFSKTSHKLKPTIRVMPNDDINAFALPGGIIYLHSELIKQAANADELIGVLAHEYGHCVHKHSLAAVFKFTVINSLSKLFFGTNSAVDVVSMIGMLNHSRTMEREADATALNVLKEMNVSAQGLKTFFYRIEALTKNNKEAKNESHVSDEKKTRNNDGSMYDAKKSEQVKDRDEKKERFKIQLPGFLSTHPHIEDRIKNIPDHMDSGTNSLLSNKAFKELKKQAGTCVVPDESFFQKMKNGFKSKKEHPEKETKKPVEKQAKTKIKIKKQDG